MRFDLMESAPVGGQAGGRPNRLEGSQARSPTSPALSVNSHNKSITTHQHTLCAAIPFDPLHRMLRCTPPILRFHLPPIYICAESPIRALLRPAKEVLLRESKSGHHVTPSPIQSIPSLCRQILDSAQRGRSSRFVSSARLTALLASDHARSRSRSRSCSPTHHHPSTDNRRYHGQKGREETQA